MRLEDDRIVAAACRSSAAECRNERVVSGPGAGSMETSTDTVEGHVAASLLSTLSGGYLPRPGTRDEMVTSPGELRPQWQKFAQHLNAMGGGELARRWDAARRQIHENGVAYNLHADPFDSDRPWELDAVPLLLATAEWSELAAGLDRAAGY